MLPITLQRASAGSGKTYALARKYIWYYITIAPEDPETGAPGPRRLRTAEELRDSLPHLLAVTFTNKATNEMQMRIVDKLYALGVYKGGAKKPDYLDIFIEELSANAGHPVTAGEISATASRALRILLDNYSLFNVSTIDSFFQKVLRTFAYETGIAESYQVELDSKMLSRMSVDGALDEIDADTSSEVSFWVSEIMKRQGERQWNIFQKKEKVGQQQETAYGQLLNSVEKLQNEEYKQIRDELEQYFTRENGTDNFRKLYELLQEKIEKELANLSETAINKAALLMAYLPDELRQAGSRTDLYCFMSLALVSQADKENPEEPPKIKSFKKESKKIEGYLQGNPFSNTLLSKYNEALGAYQAWANFLTGERYRLWKVYRTNFPFLGLLMVLTRYRDEYLQENNSVELAETSYLLKRIISDSDTPFIYERLGTRLNHFLIDEFQDTSRMQWENMRPLLSESTSRGQENLIIGDAKQSIYRFRNADSTLITTKVEEDFPGLVEKLGDAPQDNTNWRSELKVVQFNNSFFHYFIEHIEETYKPSDWPRVDLSDTYSNVMQTPHKKSGGYVEARFYDMSLEEMKNCLDKDITALIRDMRKRGHRFRDIAILVRTNAQATRIIEGITARNLDRAEGEEEIPFVSETSLMVNRAPSVRMLESVLIAIARGTDPEITQKLAENPRAKLQWNDLACNFQFYSLDKEDRNNAELLNEFLKQGAGADRLSEMLGEMESVALPAIVEAAVANFLSPEMRKRDALYIAAFQDLVLDYCGSHPTDVGSFLKWWEVKRQSAAVPSPEDLDAVTIITLHKSKGLEYPCVIVPYNDFKMADGFSKNKIEWRWVRPDAATLDPIGEFLTGEDAPTLPPYVPIQLFNDITGTCHESLGYEYFDAVKSDNTNAAYVAYTRAEEELYILAVTPTKSAGDNYIGVFIRDFLAGRAEEEGERDITELQGSDINLGGNPEDIDTSAAERGEEPAYTLITIGEKERDVAKKREEKEKKKADKNKEKPLTLTLEDYEVTDSAKKVKYRMEQLPYMNVSEYTDKEIEVDEDPNPQAEGNVKHGIMEHVLVEADLHDAVRAAELQGLIDHATASRYEGQLINALGDVREYGWFDGTLRVITERPLLHKGWKTRRPDRIMVDADSNAVIVDYKFGSPDSQDKHKEQVSRYMRLLRDTCRYRSVQGYLWYVNESLILEVD